MADEEEIFEDEIIFAAAKKNHISMLEEFYQQRLKKGTFNPNISDALGNTPLHYSATFKHIGISKRLLELGAKPNIQNKAGETPTHRAVWYNCIEMVELLIENGGDVSITNNMKQNALSLAKSSDMKALIQSALLAQKFSSAPVDDTPATDGKQRPAVAPRVADNSSFHNDMIADSDED
eukprot:gene7388-8623_t